MSLLNLNGPAGRSPRGKSSTRAWMGIGLVIAVIGFGSTFAADIQINNDETSEFGQGDTQTVYCGDNPGGEPNIITVTPISTFVNSTATPGSDAVPDTWTAPVWRDRDFKDVSSNQNTKSYLSTYRSDADGLDSQIRGYWVKSRTNDDYYEGNNTPPTGDYRTFVPQVGPFNGRYGFYEYKEWTPGFFSGGSPAVPASNTPDKFEFGGVKISDIPSACDGRDFVISAYGSGAEPLELSDVLNVTEVAVNYESGVATPAFSFDRTTPGANSGAAGKVTVSADTGSIKVLFTSAAVRQLADSVTKVVVETQAAPID